MNDLFVAGVGLRHVGETLPQFWVDRRAANCIQPAPGTKHALRYRRFVCLENSVLSKQTQNKSLLFTLLFLLAKYLPSAIIWAKRKSCKGVSFSARFYLRCVLARQIDTE